MNDPLSDYYEKHYTIFEHPNPNPNPDAKRRDLGNFREKINELLETYKLIESGYLNNKSEKLQYIKQFLKLYKEITGKDYEDTKELMDAIAAH